jgi:hypothetical protein
LEIPIQLGFGLRELAPFPLEDIFGWAHNVAIRQDQAVIGDEKPRAAADLRIDLDDGLAAPLDG